MGLTVKYGLVGTTASLEETIATLREMRQEKKLSKATVSHLIGRHPQAIEKVEQGVYSTTLFEALAQYAGFFGYTLRLTLTEDSPPLTATDRTWEMTS
ncbi:helix-turn-helix domain-containing protein [Amycolatopsis sp. NPDC059027]|uniref:helix-turn-helix domain-containing protein n=1 Tax=Amycolatopsis sp. NPDC059027 TaxID=3346709 RepID=UPI0036721C55